MRWILGLKIICSLCVGRMVGSSNSSAVAPIPRGCDILCFTKVPKSGSRAGESVVNEHLVGLKSPPFHKCFHSVKSWSTWPEQCSCKRPNAGLDPWAAPMSLISLDNVANHQHRPCAAILADADHVPAASLSRARIPAVLPLAAVAGGQTYHGPRVWLVINLRDPIKRVLSSFSHNTQIGRGNCCGTASEVRKLGGAGIKEKGIEWFVEHPGNDNFHVRMAANVGWASGLAKAERIPATALVAAKRALDSYHGILVMERFPCALEIMGRVMLGPHYEQALGGVVKGLRANSRKVNAFSAKDSLAHNTSVIPGALVERLKELNALDLELYAYANKVLDQRIGALSTHYGTEVCAGDAAEPP